MNNDKLISNDNDTIDEIKLYLENDGQIYAQYIIPVINGLAKKKVKGTFDKQLAIKAFKSTIEFSLKKYTKEFCSINDKWYNLLNVNDRTILASYLLSDYNELLNDKIKELENK
jgi:hypothetical protein